ncbi:hypothetical protein Q1695_008869 [Nippostrongylus brasiliensis]|nr:hypothetical protein Q1695_008869 [Nippostrongylus brasiliensis]
MDAEQMASTSNVVDEQGSASNAPGSKLIVNRRRQEGNPVLKYVRNVRYEWGDIGPDFECGSTCGVLYLALKYHKLHPNYILTRLSGKEENKYACRILLTLCNVDEPRHTLRELNLLCYRMDWTIVLCYSVEEAAEYIENLKFADTRDPTFKKPVFVPVDERTALQNAAVGILTGARSVTKADAQRLLFNFGSLKAISEASEEQLALCPGLGPIRAKNLFNYLRTPFTS